METTTSLPRTRKVPLRNGKITRETLNFRRVARQVMLANMFTRKTTNGHYVKSTLSSKRTAISQDQVPHRLVTKRERKHSNNMAENPSLKRRGTPELFPMSEEMKQIVISLGKLDLLPSEVRKARGDSLVEDSHAVEKSQASYKFREKTRQRIIHPQRFIRNVRSSLVNSKRIPENTEEICEEDVDEIVKDDEKKHSLNDTQEDKANYSNSNEKRDGVLVRTKSDCNILSRPQTTNFHLTAKSTKNKHYSFNNNRPVYNSRFSDLGPLPARRPLRMPGQGVWPQIAFESTRMQAREHYFPKKARRNTLMSKTWVANENSLQDNNKNNDETLKTKRWKSVESLTREIEVKCHSWLENRYGRE